MRERAPQSFFLKGAGALVALFLVTLLLAPGPEVYALRALIAVGLAIAVGKMMLRRHNIEWPQKRR